MKITITLVNKDREVIESTSREGNTSYLIKGEGNLQYSHLAEVEIEDYSVWGSNSMDAIISELLKVREELSNFDDREHVDDIIHLANKCKAIPGSALVFS
jgi:hypothetical protein